MANSTRTTDAGEGQHFCCPSPIHALSDVLSDFASNRTLPMMKSNTFPLPETHPKATANDGRGLSCVEKKGGKIDP
jgi:hypothetical protein